MNSIATKISPLVLALWPTIVVWILAAINKGNRGDDYWAAAGWLIMASLIVSLYTSIATATSFFVMNRQKGGISVKLFHFLATYLAFLFVPAAYYVITKI